MDKDLIAEAIHNAFYEHVAKRFEALCAAGDGSHYDKARAIFDADVRFAQRAYDDVVATFADEPDAENAARDAEAANFKAEVDAKKAAKDDAKVAKQSARDSKADSA